MERARPVIVGLSPGGPTATLKDVAARAGVSVGAVSRVLGGDTSLVIRPETRERVLAAAADLDYRPNRMAAGLRTRRAMAVALFLPEPQNLGWAEMIGAIQRVTAAADHLLAIAEIQGRVLDPEVISRYAMEARVDGVLLATGLLAEDLVERLASRGLPLLPIASRYRSVAASVTMQDAMGTELAVTHLAELGHRRIAFLSGVPDTDIVRRREGGFRAAMAARGIRAQLVNGDGTLVGTRPVAAALLAGRERRRPTAVVAVNLMTALGLRSEVARAGLRVPQDVSIVTFDDHVVTEHLDPPLTGIRMPMAEMGEAAARMLLEAIDGIPLRHHVVDTVPRLTIRASTGPPPDDAR